jgi:predicted TIM-barrel fold metal-dependent hydrolase
LFGTDWPVISPERAMEEIKQLGISPSVMEKFLNTNAKRLFKL